MNINLEPGQYTVAVSGGVDSVVLLDVLSRLPDIRLTVAHFDHGIREESAEDQRFVRDLAAKYRLPYAYSKGNLGPKSSEAAAREARYEFLHAARQAAGAKAVVTAHHQDDVLETAILNLIRGTGRRGLSSLQSTDIVKRPLLHVPKADIVRYAHDNQIIWREDSTNSSDVYTRNYVRHQLVPRLSSPDRQALHNIVSASRQLNAHIDRLISELLADITQQGKLDRHMFIMLPHAIAREVMLAWLRTYGIQQVDSKLLERAVHAAKTLSAGRRVSVTMKWSIIIDMINSKAMLALRRTER